MRFGLARRDITPPFQTAMAGYGVRKDLFDDVHDPLTFTAVVLEDSGRRAMIGAADLCHWPTDATTPGLMDALGRLLECPPDNVLLNASHTHGGPRLPSGVPYYYNSLPHHALFRKYADWLAAQVLDCAREAVDGMKEGSLWLGEGTTRLPMSRRLLRDGRMLMLPNPEGDVDSRLQMLALRDRQGDLAAVGIKACCHPVATGPQHRITADYPGAWRAAFAEAFGPKVMPFFLQGAGGDARPRQTADGNGWRAMKHSELPLIGRELLGESLAALARGNLRELKSLALEGRVREVVIPCEKRISRPEDLDALFQGADNAPPIYAHEWRRILAGGCALPDRAVFHVQTLWLSPDDVVIGLDAEPLCGMGRKLEARVAPARAILLGYTGGCVSYLPDAVEAARGGYEAEGYLYEFWSGPWLPGWEERIAGGIADRRAATSRS